MSMLIKVKCPCCNSVYLDVSEAYTVKYVRTQSQEESLVHKPHVVTEPAFNGALLEYHCLECEHEWEDNHGFTVFEELMRYLQDIEESVQIPQRR